MNTHLTTRPAKLEDLEMLLTFEQGIVMAERPFDPTLAEGKIHYYDLKSLIESPDSEVIVAILNDEIVGSGFARIDESKPYLRFQKHAYLGFMFVHPDHRGKGINQIVTKALVDWVKKKGLTEIRLEVYSDNLPAIRAYEKAGFTKNLLEMRMEVSKT